MNRKTNKRSELEYWLMIIGYFFMVILFLWGAYNLLVEQAYGYMILSVLCSLLMIYVIYCVIKSGHDGSLSKYLINFKDNWNKKELSVKIIEIFFWLIILLVVLILILPFFDN